MSAVKTLRPPLIWAGKSLIEDQRYDRWTPQQVSAMKHGTYNWSQHQEQVRRI